MVLMSWLLAACLQPSEKSPPDEAEPLPDTADTDLPPETDAPPDTDVGDSVESFDTASGRPAFCGLPADPSDTDAAPIGGPPAPRVITSADGDLGSAVEGLSTFAWNLSHQVDPASNMLLSPLSIAAALAMTWEGSRGATQAELAAALGIALPAAAWRTQLSALLDDLGGTSQDGGAQVQLANRLFGEDTWTWRQDFLDLCRDPWGAPLRPLPFSTDPEAGRGVINRWAERKTCGMIPDLLPPLSLKTTTRLVLANAIFAEADWSTEFDAASTAPGSFHLAGGGMVTTDFMYTLAGVRATRPGPFTVIDLPLMGGELGLWIVLPDDAAGLPAIEAAWTPTSFEGWTRDVQSQHVQLYFPRYQQRTSLDAVEALAGLGVTTLFDPARADLSGMHDGPEPLWVDQVQHQATIMFDEVGLRAAAATAVVVTSDSASSPPELRIDRPFLFVLRDDLTGTVLFVGRTVDPTAG